MITKEDIIDFFDLEAEAAKKSWEMTMHLPLNDRIRKRKAIRSVYVVRDFLEHSPEGEELYKLRAESNLSDFKEGECLILHEEGGSIFQRCTLYRFEGDKDLIISIFPFGKRLEPFDFQDIPMVLDKDLVDLRRSVYYPFASTLPSEDFFWKHNLINSPFSPRYSDIPTCEAALDKLTEHFSLKLTASQKTAVVKSMAAENYYLIQGPPGTGKSFVLGLIILAELLYFNHRVIVIGPNHLAVNNTLEQVLKLYPPYPAIVKVGQGYNAPDKEIIVNEEIYRIPNIPRLNKSQLKKLGDSWLLGMTPHSLYTSRAKDIECDTLVIDEAGQMPIPLALMGMMKARKYIFAGDHKQLAPIVTSEKIKDDMSRSIFEKLMTSDNCTLLDTSFRMSHPICNFVSELFYNGQVKPSDVNEMGLDKNPIEIIDIADEGQQTSDKEAEYIADRISEMLDGGIKASEIGILSPFRAQAANIRRHIRKHSAISEADRDLITSDTVDKMQGQEREIIFYSMTSGDLEYMTEMADFLYNPNKLNVAFSRAKSKLVIVANLDHLAKMDSQAYPHIDKMLSY